MEVRNLLDALNRDGLRKWLQEHYSTETGCWVIVKRGRPKDDIVSGQMREVL